MAKLKGVEVIEMRDGKVTEILLNGVTYENTKGDAKAGDIVQSLVSGLDVTEGGYYFVNDSYVDKRVTIIDDVGDRNDRRRDSCEVFRRKVTLPGKRILITNAILTNGHYKNGDILTVKEESSIYEGVFVEEFDDIYIGHDEYEVNVENKSEKIEPISVGDYVKVVGETCCNDLKPGEYVKVIGGRDSDGDYTIERLDGSDYDYAQENSLERVDLSDNDIDLLKLGRKIDEYKAGDIVRVFHLEDSDHGYEYGELTEIREIVDYGPNRIKGGGASRPFLYKREIELVAPVESRVDKAAS